MVILSTPNILYSYKQFIYKCLVILIISLPKSPHLSPFIWMGTLAYRYNNLKNFENLYKKNLRNEGNLIIKKPVSSQSLWIEQF